MFNKRFKQQAQKQLEAADVQVNGSRPWDIQIHDDSIFRDVFWRGSLGLGDGYTNGKWDVEQIDVFFEKVIGSRQHVVQNITSVLHSVQNFILNTQAGKRAFHVGEQHYDIGNTLYEEMLGESMGYSCGLYLDEKDTLQDAQYNKFDRLCQKLELKPGMKVLEIGSGWGTFARHAMKKYGVEVIGLTVSKEQLAYAKKICKGLPGKFILKDYQKLEASFNKTFDRVVSIEMIEAVGKKNFRTYFETVNRVLKNDGKFGLQTIFGTGKVDLFLSTRIFPNGLVPSKNQIHDGIENLFKVDEWFSFGKDYDKTLLTWEKNFRKAWPKLKNLKDNDGNRLYDERFYRMWRYYLLCCAGSFRVGHNNDAQIIMSKQS